MPVTENAFISRNLLSSYFSFFWKIYCILILHLYFDAFHSAAHCAGVRTDLFKNGRDTPFLRILSVIDKRTHVCTPEINIELVVLHSYWDSFICKVFVTELLLKG